MAFYKNENNRLVFAPNKVYNKNYTLDPAAHATYTYPADGWYWYDTENAAYAGMNLQPQKDSNGNSLYLSRDPTQAS